MKKQIGFLIAALLCAVVVFSCKKNSTDTSLSAQIAGEYGKTWVLTGYKINGVDTIMTPALKSYKFIFSPSGNFSNSDGYKGVWTTSASSSVQTITVLYNPVNNQPAKSVVYTVQSVSNSVLVVTYTTENLAGTRIGTLTFALA